MAADLLRSDNGPHLPSEAEIVRVWPLNVQAVNKDFFISYTALDECWAEWIAWELEALGFQCVLQKWDFKPGSNFILRMDKAARQCRRLVFVLSRASLEAEFVRLEWASFLERDPTGEKSLLLPIRVDECQPDGLLAGLVYLDFHDIAEDIAKLRLEKAVYSMSGMRLKPMVRPIFPGSGGSPVVTSPRFPSPTSVDAPSSTANKDYSWLTTAPLPTIRERIVGRSFVENDINDFAAHFVTNGHALSVVTVDVDGMGGINAKFGIDVGDQVMDRIVELAEGSKHRLLVGRMGDDTVFLILVESNEDTAFQEARRIVSGVRRTEWGRVAFDLFVKCSAGVAQFNRKEGADVTLARAVLGQRQARREGGDKAHKGPLKIPDAQLDAAPGRRLRGVHWFGT
jgi:diguanylate cyclase (GGDEF)-like protein